MVVFLCIGFLTGGGARSDIQSLVFLRPFSVLVCFVALITLRWDQVIAYKFLFGMAAAVFALIGLHLVLLPPPIWSELPGREPLAAIDKVAGLGKVWRPLTMDPDQAWNAFYSMFAPLAVLLLGVQLRRSELFNLLWVALALGLLSAFWAVLQLAGQVDGPLYLYRITNYGVPVGLFSNRNHQAMLLAMLYPMLAVYAATAGSNIYSMRFRLWGALAAGAALLPLILVTGSRAGLLAALCAMVASLFIWQRYQSASHPRTQRDRSRTRLYNARVALLGLGVLSLIGITVLMSRAEAIKRLSGIDQAKELRLQIWPPIIDLVYKYFPVGSGVGSFVKVYQIDEPIDLLSFNYLNHAHNDILEVLMTAGLPGALLILIAIAAGIKAAIAAFASPAKSSLTNLSAQMAVVILCIFAFGSAVDYPLRTPSMACLFVVAALWLAGPVVRSREGGTDA